MLSTAQKVQPGATERSWPEGVAFCASSFRIARTWWLGTVYQKSAPLTVKLSSGPFLSTDGVRNAGMPQRCRRPGADDVVLQPDQLAVGVHAGLDLLVGERPGEIHRHVVFARIDQLHRLADGLRGEHRGHHHVAIETPAEAAADEVLVQHHVLGIDAERAGSDAAGARGELVAGVDVPHAVLLIGRGIHRLERRVDVDGGEILRLHRLGRAGDRRRRIALLDEELARHRRPACSRLASSISVWSETLA